MEAVISGYGRMGRAVEKILAEKGLACAGKSEDIASFSPETAAGAVCIDFTTPEAFRKNYRFIAESFKGAVVGTTGWTDISEDVFRAFRECGKPFVYASNFSIGVNVMFKAAQLLSHALGNSGGYDPYIVEMHHKHKLDAPSGTAKTLAGIVEEGMGVKVPVESVRCGEISGIHELGLEGPADRIVLRHEAFSREGFARGAVQAAIWCDALEGGIYEFKDLLKF